MHAFFVAVDIALAILSLRSIWVARLRAPWTSAGWAGTFAYCIAAAIEFSSERAHQIASIVGYVFLIVLAAAFVIAGIRDEPQAEPWWWPSRVGRTRAGTALKAPAAPAIKGAKRWQI